MCRVPGSVPCFSLLFHTHICAACYSSSSLSVPTDPPPFQPCVNKAERAGGGIMFIQLRRSTVTAARLAARARAPAGATVPRARSRVLLAAARSASSQIPTSTGINVGTAAAGMLAAAIGGIGIGLLLPTQYLVGGPEAEKQRGGHHQRQGSEQYQQTDKQEAYTADEAGSLTAREDSNVYGNVSDIAEDIPRPAIIQDATRSHVESLYEFHSCIASGGSATVWRATARDGPSGRDQGRRQAAAARALSEHGGRVAGAVHGPPEHRPALRRVRHGPDDVSPDGEWHLVMELAEGGELFERLLAHGAYPRRSRRS